MTWTMQDETVFIDHIGTWASDKGISLTVSQKLALLRGYRLGLSRRNKLTNLDAKALEDYVNKEITKLQDLPQDRIL